MDRFLLLGYSYWRPSQIFTNEIFQSKIQIPLVKIQERFEEIFKEIFETEHSYH